jgi:hypothetical protein
MAILVVLADVGERGLSLSDEGAMSVGFFYSSSMIMIFSAQRAGDRPRLVHVPDQHRPHGPSLRIPGGCR